MTYTAIQRRPCVSTQELGECISLIHQFGKEKDLENQKLNAEQVKKVIRFITGINERAIQQLLPQDALTLLRLTPALLEAKSSATVHAVIYHAVPIIKKINQDNPKPEYQTALETAGKVCFSRKLTATTNERRSEEFDIFKDIVGDTENYQTAYTKFKKRNHMATLSDMQIFGEAVRTYHFVKGRGHYSPSYERE